MIQFHTLASFIACVIANKSTQDPAFNPVVTCDPTPANGIEFAMYADFDHFMGGVPLAQQGPIAKVFLHHSVQYRAIRDAQDETVTLKGWNLLAANLTGTDEMEAGEHDGFHHLVLHPGQDADRLELVNGPIKFAWVDPVDADRQGERIAHAVNVQDGKRVSFRVPTYMEVEIFLFAWDQHGASDDFGLNLQWQTENGNLLLSYEFRCPAMDYARAWVDVIQEVEAKTGLTVSTLSAGGEA